MGDTQRWSVTYTKHVKQKRKVYQDGFLEIQSSRHKVILYDEWDKLLESRFLKKDDFIASGETLAFECYLVDIAEQCGDEKPTSISNFPTKDAKASDKVGVSSISKNRKPTFGRTVGRRINLSPSQKVIQDFKKTEIKKLNSSPSCVDKTKTSVTGWQVLYTTQITQKAKKFHDGFLQLVFHGSQGRQAMLYDANRRHLSSRFLKKDEILCLGRSLSFEGHLVEIGEAEVGERKLVSESTTQGQKRKPVGELIIVDEEAGVPTNRNAFVRESVTENSLPNLKHSSSMVESSKLSWSNPTIEPRRAVHDILSILRQPIAKKVVALNSPLSASCLNEYAEQCCSSSEKEMRGGSPDHDCKIKVVKQEAKVIIALEESKVPEERRHPDSECPRPAEFGILTRSNGNEPERIITESNTAAASSWSSSDQYTRTYEACDDEGNSSRRPEEAYINISVAPNDRASNHQSHVGEKSLETSVKRDQMVEFPSFDLGF